MITTVFLIVLELHFSQKKLKTERNWIWNCAQSLSSFVLSILQKWFVCKTSYTVGSKKTKQKQLSVFPNKFIWVCKFANIALQLNIWVTYFRGFKSLQFILLFYIIHVKSTLPELFTSHCTLDHTKIRQHHRLAFHGPKQKHL